MPPPPKMIGGAIATLASIIATIAAIHAMRGN